ncbi:DegT/DnrJ/EryC1/StrS family aminotransferase [Bizionia gelidisalsuginis]|uniref:DegT/DnrJ/EryC1/StrS family aminotransferase n=2 Tax=Bizionia TaxID=283785 RepID=A0A8H2LGU9_9FLAO|nr:MULTISPECIES: DegT/DnrJ/EryC1/StrS family aminotransferase [Bizionia]TYB80257.1 DegT/DnrJ/EryC1/StrS family aminotransferase [Bizionia saleffrena]TYC17100.1 DegT/DnrJ/EryC1/StrS family aminotransferase [Bizionia gelidisalsuginis]
MINVTQTFLPPIEEYTLILNRAWRNKWITNRGELLIELEAKLSDVLGVEHFFVTTNGTLPLQIAIKALGITKEIITTPFSYVATTSSIVWENCTPVFVDIEKETLTIDCSKIEAAITSDTEAILVTHVFGNPCDIEAIAVLAKKHNLKVIYDGAHCFNVQYKGQSIFNYGDVSTVSFHSTKLFHTGEGGAMFMRDKVLYDKVLYHHNFGHNGREKFHGLGINAKASELQAAMGLAVLPYMKTIIEKRKQLVEIYENVFRGLEGIQLVRFREGATRNYSYMPVIFKDEGTLLKVKKALEDKDIVPRRYFYPSLNTLDYVHSNKEMPVSESISKRILCLPLYYELKEEEVKLILSIITNTI